MGPIYRWGQAELADLPPLETTCVTLLCKSHPTWVGNSSGTHGTAVGPDPASRDLPTELLRFNFSKYLLAASTRTDALARECRKCKTVPAFKRRATSLGSDPQFLRKVVERERNQGLGTLGLRSGPDPVICGFGDLGSAA